MDNLFDVKVSLPRDFLYHLDRNQVSLVYDKH